MRQPQDPTSAIRWLPVVNSSSDPIPPYAVMRVIGIDSTTGYYQVGQPNADSMTEILINGPSAIPGSAEGQGHRSDPCTVLYETIDGTPAVGEDWGTESGSWKLKKGNTGFRVIGASTNENTAEMTFLGAGAGVVVQEVDGSPSYTTITTLSFDQADGFIVTNPSAGVARIDIASAGELTTGVITSGTQVIDGIKTFMEGVVYISDYSVASENYDRGTLFLANTTEQFVWLFGDTDESATQTRFSISTYVTGMASLTVPTFSIVSTSSGTTYLFDPNNSGHDPVLKVKMSGTEFTGVTGTAGDGGVYKAGLCTTLGSGVSYTDEEAQDAVGGMLVDSSDIDFTYNDGTPSITASLTTTGVSASTYTKVTVDTKGRVTAGSTLSTSDLPDFAGLTTLSGSLASDDVFPLSDTSAGANRKITAATLLAAFMPPGMIMPYAGSTTPTGWLDCDGSAVSRTTYADLFAAISTTWGAGNGSTTFNVPDLRGRAIIGSGTGSGLTARTLAATGGAETHTLATSEIPSHSHAAQNGETFVTYTGGPALNVTNSGAINLNLYSDTQTTGGGGSHNNMQPFAVCKWIIKT